MIRDAIFHNHVNGKPVFFLYKLKSVVYNALLSAGKLPLMVDYIYQYNALWAMNERAQERCRGVTCTCHVG